MDKYDEMISARAVELLEQFAAFNEKQGGDIDNTFQSWTIITMAKMQIAVENIAKAIEAKND